MLKSLKNQTIQAWYLISTHHDERPDTQLLLATPKK